MQGQLCHQGFSPCCWSLVIFNGVWMKGPYFQFIVSSLICSWSYYADLESLACAWLRDFCILFHIHQCHLVIHIGMLVPNCPLSLDAGICLQHMKQAFPSTTCGNFVGRESSQELIPGTLLSILVTFMLFNHITNYPRQIFYRHNSGKWIDLPVTT